MLTNSSFWYTKYYTNICYILGVKFLKFKGLSWFNGLTGSFLNGLNLKILKSHIKSGWRVGIIIESVKINHDIIEDIGFELLIYSSMMLI